MEKNKFIIAIIIVVAVAMKNSKKEESSLKIASAQDLTRLVEEVYEKKEKPLPSIETTEIDVSDESMVNSMTGLENGDNLEYLVVSEPMISSQAYSFVVAKVKSGVNADNIAKKMVDGINPRKWICVSAEKVSATSSGDVVCLVMTDKETTDKIMEGFKEVAGTVGKVYSEDVEDIPISNDMPGFDMNSLDVPNVDTDTEISNETEVNNEISNDNENSTNTEVSNEVSNEISNEISNKVEE